jgi:hypothetical protein
LEDSVISSTQLKWGHLTGSNGPDTEAVLRLPLPPDATASHLLECTRQAIETITGANLSHCAPRTLRNEIHRAARKLREIATVMQKLETRAMVKDTLTEASERIGKYAAEDRKHFDAIGKLIEANYCRSMTAVAKPLALADKLVGPGTPDSKAKRLARLYLKEGLAQHATFRISTLIV